MKATRIIVFAKAPVPGMVKTRLIPALGEQGAADLARSMLLRTLDETLAAKVGEPELCADPDPTADQWRGLAPRAGFRLSAQGDGDLGARLSRAAARAAMEDVPAILIGTDCPALDRRRLREIAGRLVNHDAVLYPASDGGYVALGLRRYDPSLFADIAWSSAIVAEQTKRRIAALGWSLNVGDTLRDIDTPADL